MTNLKHLIIDGLFLALFFLSFLYAGGNKISFGKNPYHWKIKKSDHRKAPGPNFWSASSKNVFVDKKHRLHLVTSYSRGKWQCAEIASKEKFGYGEYTFFITGNVTGFHKNLVAGLFLYRNDRAEIDIEFSRWGKQERKEVLNFAIHSQDQLHREQNLTAATAMQLHGRNPQTTHKIFWSEDSVRFQSYQGHYPELPSPNYLISDTVISAKKFPLPRGVKMRVIFNLYWYKGDAKNVNPRRQTELIINDFIYKKY